MRTMKTLKILNQTIAAITISLLSIVSLAQVNLNVADLFSSEALTNAISFTFAEESYIDDIPFDTEMIALNTEFAYADYDEEAIDDIPFDTEIVALQSELAKFNYADEESIDDIPFNTEMVAANYHYAKSLEIDIDFAIEEDIKDIPFDTYCVLTEGPGAQCKLNMDK